MFDIEDTRHKFLELRISMGGLSVQKEVPACILEPRDLAYEFNMLQSLAYQDNFIAFVDEGSLCEEVVSLDV